MNRIISFNVEIDTSEKAIYIGEENSSGVEECYDSIDDIAKHLRNYVEMYHQKEIEEENSLEEI